ncbi:MAG: methyltransferase domain-containing protein [Anaerolineales bacterium]
MALPLELAARRYRQQAGWTAQLRRHLFARAGLPNARRVLDIGCGTGAVLAAIEPPPRTRLFGLDIDKASLHMAQQEIPRARFTSGDAHRLPYFPGSFDIAFFHFVLLWLADPLQALREAARVTRPGAFVIAFAEPDYSQRINKPASMLPLGALQTEALRMQGADPGIGGHLAKLFRAAGLAVLESGQLQMAEQPVQRDDALEWEVLQADLADRVPGTDLERLATEYYRASQSGALSLHVPTFFAIARVN